MKRLTKHFKLLRSFEEFQFKHWLDKHASEFLTEIGIEAGQVILDFGCGSGTYTIPAAKLVGKSGIVYALDIKKGFLDKIEKKAKHEGLKNIVIIHSSSKEKIPLENENIDLMLLIDVLQEIDDKENLFDEAYRILKQNGIIVIYPMHLVKEEIERLAINKGFNLEDRKFQGNILIFKKAMR